MTNDDVKRILRECKGCKYLVQDDTWSGECTADGKCFEAKMMAIEAIEKQIPKKPKTFITEIYYYCPVCSEQIELVPIDHNVTTYCSHCGQAIDWSGDEVDVYR